MRMQAKRLFLIDYNSALQSYSKLVLLGRKEQEKCRQAIEK